MNKIATFAVLVAVCMPSFASAAMLNATPAEIMSAITSELALMSSQVTKNGIVAGVSTMTPAGLVMEVNGTPYMQFHTATAFNVAKELCYINATNFLGSDENFTCEFNGVLIFESAVDARY